MPVIEGVSGFGDYVILHLYTSRTPGDMQQRGRRSEPRTHSAAKRYSLTDVKAPFRGKKPIRANTREKGNNDPGREKLEEIRPATRTKELRGSKKGQMRVEKTGRIHLGS